MKLGIMQPYFFPYLGYFQLINMVDQFVLFDDVQYIRHGWINRNRILKPESGWQYIVAPLENHSQKTLISDIRLKNGKEEWKGLILRQMAHYKKRAPYYDEVVKVVNACFDVKETNVSKFNRACLLIMADYLEIDANITISSEMGFDYSNVKDAGEWALRISEQMGAREYINPAGGRELFDPAKFSKSGIKLSILSTDLSRYSQKRKDPFEAGLSILDVMMFNSPEEIRFMLDEYRLEQVNNLTKEAAAKTASLPFYKTLFFSSELLELFSPELMEFACI